MKVKEKEKFNLISQFKPAGDQISAIESLVKGLKNDFSDQTLLGVTGSGKTFTIANVIQKFNKPALIIAHNKTLAAQLAQEYKSFFPHNAVHYFVSYYDYYQPEAYIPSSDTYIEKEAMINEEIERLRHATTQALLTRKDVIIVASVSCIYGLGSPEEYEKVNLKISKNMEIGRNELIRKLIDIHFTRTNADIKTGQFRALGNNIEIMPVNERTIYKVQYDGIRIGDIVEIDPVTRQIRGNHENVYIFPAKHFISDDDAVEKAIKAIEAELKDQLRVFEKEGKIIEAERLKRRIKYDVAMLREIGYVNGIENYSRHFSGKDSGEAPDTLLSYFPHDKDGRPDFLTIIDESHVTVPQLNGMYAGDASRKKTLIEHGFRLPSAKDNRPLKFDEFRNRVKNIIYTSATPGKYEIENSKNIAEQIIRPTGLIDPTIEIKPIQENRTNGYEGQIKDFIKEAQIVIDRGDRVLATTLTKKMAEDLSEYLKDKGFKVSYLHSDIKTIERITILTDFRKGKYDCLIGVNLLREGLDLPEVSLIAIFDADKEGFLRSETSLIQTIGRAARNINGKILLYADNMTGSIERALKETERRRNLQIEYNKKHNITPKTIKKEIKDITENIKSKHEKTLHEITKIDEEEANKDFDKFIKAKRLQLEEAVKDLDFETAAVLRDEIAYFMNQKLSVKTKKH